MISAETAAWMDWWRAFQIGPKVLARVIDPTTMPEVHLRSGEVPASRELIGRARAFFATIRHPLPPRVLVDGVSYSLPATPDARTSARTTGTITRTFGVSV